MIRRLILALALVLGGAPAIAAPAPSSPAPSSDVQTVWQLLDYLAVDYAGAVKDGKIISTPEYAEMREFSASAAEKIAALPANPAKSALLAEGKQFAALIDRKGNPDEVRAAAHALGQHLLSAYPVPLGPRQAPDLARGVQLFQENCASCHGAKGDA
ncbi:MAG TPA: c-type cytochrome, partial [Sphingomicrobium sp.]|nr:c-type cytochrome [Sphingomicrobium sp.]